MSSRAWKYLASVAASFAVVVGCSTDFSGITGGTTGGGGTAVGTEEVDLPAEATQSFFTAFQVDPVPEDTAGPKFVVSADIDQDGLMDLVSGWNQNQPVQLHLQRRDAAGVISFRTVTLGGTTPIAVIAGIEVGQINGDGWLDVVVLSKASGIEARCPMGCPQDGFADFGLLDGQIIVLFSPGNQTSITDGDAWSEMLLVNPFVRVIPEGSEVSTQWVHNQFPGNEVVGFDEAKTKPEWNGFTSLVVANIDGRAGDDILVALNPGGCEDLGQGNVTNTVDLWVNPGPGLAEVSKEWGVPVDGLPHGAPVVLTTSEGHIKDLLVSDVDADGDLDVILTAWGAISRNIRWIRNPLVPHQAGGPGGFNEVVAGLRTGVRYDVDTCVGDREFLGKACPNGQGDCQIPDGSCVAGVCVGGKTPGSDCDKSADCAGVDACCKPDGWWLMATGWEDRPVGQVDSNADVMALGDIDNDGFDDVVVRSTNGRIVQWFRRPNEDPIVGPEFPPGGPTPDRFNFPWPVFTLTEFPEDEPQAIGVGDVTGDGQNEVMVAIGGGIFFYEITEDSTVFDPWAPTPLIQDRPPSTTTDPRSGNIVGGTGVGIESVDASTHINTLLIADIDGDGKQDIVGTLDRRTSSGLSDDRLVWYRNFLGE